MFHPLRTTGLIPLVLVTALTFKVYSSIPAVRINSNRRRAGDFMRAKICSVIVLIFVLFNLPRLTIGAFEVSRWDTFLLLFRSFSMIIKID